MRGEIVITGAGAVRGPALEALPEVVRMRAARTERVTQLVLSAAGAALDVAGLAVTEGEPRARIGIVLGTAFGCLATNASFQHRLAGGGVGAASPRLFAATVSNAAAGELAIAYRLGGPAITLTAGSVAGLVAIAHACDLLDAGAADAIVTGGMDAVDDAVERWIAAGGLGGARAVGEGAAVLVLERAAHAVARHAPIHGVLEATEAGFDASGSRADATDRVTSAGFAAAGPFEVIAALGQLPPGGRREVADACPTGHTARLVVRRAA